MALPRVSLQHTQDINQKLLATLKEQHIPVTGFVNEGMVDIENETNERVAILRQWATQGFELGNHTYHHVNYNTTPFQTFVNEVKKGEIYTNQVLKKQNKSIKYFRPPFLATGITIEQKQKLDTFLVQNNYRLVLSTIEASDFTFNLIYLKAKFEQDSSGMKQVVKDYIEFTQKRLIYYEAVTDTVVGRPIPQILLLHVNDINTDNLDKIIALLKARGYKFISLEKALQDTVYNQKDTYVGKRGISWLHRWNLKDRKALMKQEPKLSPRIKKLNKEAKQDQFYFLFKSRLAGFKYTAYHIGVMVVSVLSVFLLVYILLFGRKKPVIQRYNSLEKKVGTGY